MGIELSALVLAIMLSFAAFVTATEDESDGFKGGENTSGQGDFPLFTLQITKQVSSRSIELTILLSDYFFSPHFFFDVC